MSKMKAAISTAKNPNVMLIGQEQIKTKKGKQKQCEDIQTEGKR